MKQLIFIPLLLLLVMSFACTKSDSIQESKFDFRDLPSGHFIEDSLRQSGDTIGYVVGHFGKSDSDTLYCIAIGCHWYVDPDSSDVRDCYDNNMDTYRFSNSNLGIADLYLTDVPFLDYVKTTELDGDGIDELQFFNNWPTSTWLSYKAVDYYNGEWLMLTRPVTFSTNKRAVNDSTLVFFDYSYVYPDSVIVFEDEYFPPEDAIFFVTVPKFLAIDRKPISHDYDTCFTLPGGKPIKLPINITPNLYEYR